MLIHRMTAVGSLLVSVALYWASIYSGEEMGYQFPRVVAVALIALSVVLVVTAFKRSLALSADEEPVPWARIWPALLVFAGYLLLARILGFFVTSFLAFLTLGLIYAPGRLDARRLVTCAGVGVAFMAVLYLIFVSLLNVQMPRGHLF